MSRRTLFVIITAAVAVAAGTLLVVVADGQNNRDFPDVRPGHPRYYDIRDATGYGWFVGYTNGTFRPGQKISATQLSNVIRRIFGTDGIRRDDAAAFVVAGCSVSPRIPGCPDPATNPPSRPVDVAELSSRTTWDNPDFCRNIPPFRLTDIIRTDGQNYRDGYCIVIRNIPAGITAGYDVRRFPVIVPPHNTDGRPYCPEMTYRVAASRITERRNGTMTIPVGTRYITNEPERVPLLVCAYYKNPDGDVMTHIRAVITDGYGGQCPDDIVCYSGIRYPSECDYATYGFRFTNGCVPNALAE